MIFRKIHILVLVTLFLFIYGCGFDNYAVFHTSKGDYKINVEISDTEKSRANGLMLRESLEKDQGMLFIFPDENKRAFWMKNTLISLDIIFVDEDGKIVTITENAQPCGNINDTDGATCKLYESLKPAKYVIEIAEGESMKHGIEPGNIVDLLGK